MASEDQASGPHLASDGSDRIVTGDDLISKRRETVLARADDATSRVRLNGQSAELSDLAAREHYCTKHMRTGLAFSGGGIRSATISLGMSEALAARGRLYAFDMLSTVSGGGYFGSFFRALHLPRGDLEKEIVPDRPSLAEATMISLPDQQYFRGDSGNSPFVASGKAVKNPLWWLRENGRYLAPAGMTDYGFALAYIIRGWVSLLLFCLGFAFLAFAFLQLILVGIVNFGPGWDWWLLSRLAERQLHSPLFPALAIWALICAGISGGYWLLTPLPYARGQIEKDQRNGMTWAILLFAFWAAVLVAIFQACQKGQIPLDDTAQWWAFGAAIAIGAALLSTLIVAINSIGTSHVDARRKLTRLLAGFLMILLALVAATLIDWAALSLRLVLDAKTVGNDSGEIAKTGALSGFLASVLSFLIAKLPDWFGGERSAIGRFLVLHARKFALVAAIIILFAIALLADVLAIKLLWKGTAWLSPWPLQWKIFGPVIGLVALITLVCASSRNFANLLALTPFYASRLTRAFIGGSNVFRLDSSERSQVTRGYESDDIELQSYMEADTAAPFHFINATRNRTVGEAVLQDHIEGSNDDPFVAETPANPRGRLATYESTLTLHDRHGDRMIFGPAGLRVGGVFYGWKDLREVPSLGLLCAISGAAVGAGMGRLTSLGTSMAFTLANIRLGYWWKEQATKGGGGEENGSLLARIFPGFDCLARELLGRFGTRDHWFLSDGGHSENSGVLTLLERGCGFILACDNGQDADYRFCDLETLIRTARTDIGMEVAAIRSNRFPKSFEGLKPCFFNGTEGDWRAHAADKENSAFALLLTASDIPRRVNGVWKRRRRGSALIVWVKPKLFAGLPADIATYALVNPEFPQQSTGNQFFDEAQWESYRRLGFEMGRRLFIKQEAFNEYMPVIHPKS